MQVREVQTKREPLTLKSPSGVPLRICRGASGYTHPGAKASNSDEESQRERKREGEGEGTSIPARTAHESTLKLL